MNDCIFCTKKRKCLMHQLEIAKKELGWEPKVSLEEGLCKTVEFFKARLVFS